MDISKNEIGFNAMETTLTHNAEFSATRGNLGAIVGTKLDNAQYIAMTLMREADRTKGKVGIGHIYTPNGRRYNLSISGQPVALDYKGQVLTLADNLERLLNEGRENELHYDALAYIEAEGETPSGKRFIGVFYTIADAKKYILEEAAKGEL